MKVPSFFSTKKSKSTTSSTSQKMSPSHQHSTSTSSDEYTFTNGYSHHSPESPESFGSIEDMEHDQYDAVSSARHQYAKILYDHTRKQMEKFAKEASSRGTLRMDQFPYQQTTAASN